MQATVIRLMVEEGSTVVTGDTLCVLEAMKMEQPIVAHRDGSIVSIRVLAGDSVSGGQHLMEIQ
jgi:acetyl-CoA/propionyl-CoA carboxylase biotin carboxyl carrier protein